MNHAVRLQPQKRRAQRITLFGTETLGDVVALERLIGFQIEVPFDADLNWPVHGMGKTKVTLYRLLMEVCRSTT